MRNPTFAMVLACCIQAGVLKKSILKKVVGDNQDQSMIDLDNLTNLGVNSRTITAWIR
jgi:hypothetical protein